MTLKKILVIRFSAMGDVMLLVPVLKSLLAAYPDLEVTLVTRPRFSSFFANIERLKVFEADVDYQYNGLLGMRDLCKALMRKGNYGMVLDLHDHIRTMMLRNFFRLFGKKVIVFTKGRKEKKAFTKKEGKMPLPLPHTVERYHDAFRKAGFEFHIIPPPYLVPDDESIKNVEAWLSSHQLVKAEKWIGIAPFAMHRTKIWPRENYVPLITSLIEKKSFKIFFFGGGEKEVEFFQTLKEKFPNHCHIVAGQLKIKHEMALLRYIDLMLCADSSNMHLAALTGTPLLSIWGGTHPDVGFGPYGYNRDSVLQISQDELPCRPCSVYGKETCYRGDFACMTRITPDVVFSEIGRRLGDIV